MTDNSSFTFDIGEAITPLDGRNMHKLKKLRQFYSDFILTKYRVKLEIEYLIKLSRYKVIRKLTKQETITMYQYIKIFNFEDYKRVREIEKRTNHEAKSAEEYVKKKLMTTSLSDVAQMIHFGLTSDDINNLAYGLIIKNVVNQVFFPELKLILRSLKESARKYKNLSMLSRTHGQPAAPTTMGKEYLVYYKRLKDEVEMLKNLKIRGKLTGNTGNFNAHQFIFPKLDWLKFSQDFVSSLDLEPDLITTQIEPYDSLIRLFQVLLRINNILLGLSIDFWFYISLGYFKQKLIKKEVGSTAMPHKINPIYFEGSEGGFGIANSLLEFYCRKLSYSRLQRDLSDSTVRRSFGVAFGYSLLSYQSINEALNRIEADRDSIKEDLNKHLEVVSEAIQNFLRTKNYSDAYDKTKVFFRGREVNSESIKKFIESLKIGEEDKKKLIELYPENYTGLAEKIVTKFI
ncbi:adenylosuccinate lyase [Candidatus Roizmanbacteria bacterium CG03_land_8_20_14_0_80_35_26]|uniref:Adenylosuccinate lyase n=2 Tax=Candidatus Roizmaniibacteriota TaxID=1752723 RepID=A0A2M7BVR3_9BACT|nr:MAG: adenylosuccinate lyase [Candidatus Roizmanbacteria bacterium CG11_big_fil_rev_8_21_14_0_20_35_14]PIV10615.1 MAG: adenylosuccinate lyase [Candidatus Roizmanbacteria bacterium CG03_land_8_20_14_0_80_35_26]